MKQLMDSFQEKDTFKRNRACWEEDCINVDIANFFPNTSRKMVFQSLMRESDLPADIFCGFITEICLRNGGHLRVLPQVL